MNWWKYAIGFAIGAGAGIFGTYKYLNAKYEKLYNDEIESVKSYYNSKNAAKLNEEAKNDILKSMNENVKNEPVIRFNEVKLDKPEMKNVEQIIDYTGYSTASKPVEKAKEKSISYISNDEFDRDLEYDKRILTYYQGDHVLADGDDIVSIDDTIGKDAIGHFGDYEEDALFVKNDFTETCYEVYKDYTSFSDYAD